MKPFRTSWTQFQGDSDNSGYAALRTDPLSNRRWDRDVGSAGGGSPIIDPWDGGIYLADAIGQLTKYDAANGNVVWTRPVGNNVQWGSTPAIDSAGRVYALFSNFMESVLVCLDRNGNERWRWTPAGPTNDPDHRTLLWGSPKVWNLSGGGALIFLTLTFLNFPLDTQWTLLIAFNQDGLALATVWYSTSFIFTAEGGGGFRVLPVTHQGHPFTAVASADAASVGQTGAVAAARLPWNQHLWEPTCSVIDGAAPDFPLVITTDGIGTVAAFQWGTGRNPLTQLWIKAPSRDGFPKLTPPAVLPNGLLAIGCSDGELKLLDPSTGEFLKPWPDLDAPIVGTPASFLRQIYVTTFDGHVAMVDSNGILKTKVEVKGGTASSPLVTATNIYVSARDRFYAFDLFLNPQREWQQPGGVSSWAVGADGSVFLVAGEEIHAPGGSTHIGWKLWAFSPPA